MAAAFGLYTHIQANRRRSVALVAALFLLVYAMVFAGALLFEGMRGGPSLDVILARALEDMIAHLPAATLGCALWVAIAYKAHQWMIDVVTHSHEVTRAQEPRLYNLLENLCISRGVTMPRLKIMDSEVLNAFASGMTDSQYAVTVTRGLLEALDDRELEGVLAHELTHIRNGDVRLMVVAVVIAGVISLVAELLYRWFAYSPSVRFSNDDRSDRRASPATSALFIAGAIVIVAWVVSGLLRFALSRSREYLADAGAVELTKDPDAMISALLKISGRAEIPGAPSGIMEMCIENQRSGFIDLFATHPPIDERVAALVRHAGGRMPQEIPARPSFIPQATVVLDRRLSPWERRA